MKTIITLISVLVTIFFSPLNFSEPGFNGPTPGCGAAGCHTQLPGIVSVVANGLDVEVTVSGTTSSVAGELVDASGTVVAVNNSTSNNPFTLTVPSEGTYLVNAGYKDPDPRSWDSVSVVIALTGVGDNTTEPMLTYKLYSNYPNPFNPSTKIKYSVAENTFVSLKIYDVAGSEVASIVNRVQAAGEYEINFNAGSLTSGVYIYKIQAGDFVQTKKMILMK
ncbi:MAG: T9SS type A sorting domain-containing protein [Ignavibacteriaceae bacterium]|jgi:hypothetical protein